MNKFKDFAEAVNAVALIEANMGLHEKMSEIYHDLRIKKIKWDRCIDYMMLDYELADDEIDFLFQMKVQSFNKYFPERLQTVGRLH